MTNLSNFNWINGGTQFQRLPPGLLSSLREIFEKHLFLSHSRKPDKSRCVRKFLILWFSVGISDCNHARQKILVMLLAVQVAKIKRDNFTHLFSEDQWWNNFKAGQNLAFDTVWKIYTESLKASPYFWWTFFSKGFLRVSGWYPVTFITIQKKILNNINIPLILLIWKRLKIPF